MSERERKLEVLGYPIDRTTPEGKRVDALPLGSSGEVAMILTLKGS